MLKMIQDHLFITQIFRKKSFSFPSPDDAGLTGKVRESANKIARDSGKMKEASDRINHYENETAKMRVEVNKLLEGASKDDISKAKQQGKLTSCWRVRLKTTSQRRSNKVS